VLSCANATPVNRAPSKNVKMSMYKTFFIDNSRKLKVAG
jgi:hypothetical protein